MTAALLLEVVGLASLYSPPTRFRDDLPFYWRFGTPPVERLERFSGLADGYLPAGAEVCFSSRLEDPGEAFFVYLWASYLLPRVTLRPAGDPPLPPGCSHWITYLRTGDASGAEALLHTDDGVVYRLAP